MALQQSHSAKSFGSSKQQYNLDVYEVLCAHHSHMACLIRALIGWVQSIKQS